MRLWWTRASGACCRRVRPGTALVAVWDDEHADQLVVHVHVKPWQPVEVVRVADIELDLGAMAQVTNLQPDAAYYLPVRFFDANRMPLTNAALGPGMPMAHDVAYLCSVDSASAAWAFATKEHKHGVDYCVCPDSFDIKNVPTALLLQFSVRDRTGRAYKPCTRTFTVPFTASFMLRHRGEVAFSPQLRKGTMEVLLLLLLLQKPNQLLGHSSEPALVEVRELRGALLLHIACGT